MIHPPIDINKFKPTSTVEKPGYFLAAGAFVSYKRFDIAIEACRKAQKKLIIAGSGPLESKIKNLAGPNVEVIVSPNQRQWVELMQKADALLFPGVEDFGMTPVEAMASGTPVIAYKAGGALDYIEEGHTGLFFDLPNADSLATVLKDFNPDNFKQTALMEFAGQFSRSSFISKIQTAISESVET